MTKVLVVDDDPTCLDATRMLLGVYGFEVATAANAQEAADAADTFRPDVLVVDWMLRDQADGLQVARAMRAVIPKLRVIVVTGYPSAELEARIRTFHGAKFLPKPASAAELVAAIEQLAQA